MATHSSDSCLENSMVRGSWWATVCGVAKSQNRAQGLHFHCHEVFHDLILCLLKLNDTLGCPTDDIKERTIGMDGGFFFVV